MKLLSRIKLIELNLKAYGISDAEHIVNMNRQQQFLNELNKLGITHD